MSKYSEYRYKREKLELFVKEQIIGPGIFNKKFFLLDNWDDNEFVSKQLSQVDAFDNHSEIITDTPAYLYSSAILFPQTRNKDNRKELKDNGIGESPIIDDEDLETINHDEDNLIEDRSESLTSKQQNYPNVFGLSFVVKPKTDLTKDLNISFEYRKYEKLSKDEANKLGLGMWINTNRSNIENYIEKYFRSVLKTVTKDDNLFVTLSISEKTFSEKKYEISYEILNSFVQNEIIPLFSSDLRKNVELLATKDNIEFYGIKEEKEDIRLYSISTKTYKGQSYKGVIDLFEGKITKVLFKNKLDNKSFIDRYETYKQLKDILNSFKSIYGNSSMWSSEFKKVKIELERYDPGKKIIRSEQIRIESEDGLFYSYQYFRDQRTNKTYVKILVLNDNIVDNDSGIPTFLNKSDEGNKRSFFGIKISVQEKKENILTQYNPPNLIEFDEEDNFNKLLYRQFKDYGEGYNTSVNWGVNEITGLRFITTEFLPEEETPKVDFEPSKLENGKIISRLEDSEILSMRRLSTLSERNDKDIIDDLTYFIDTYRSWIDEKKEELLSLIQKGDMSEGSTEAKVLNKQIRSLYKDHKRLKRNIKLLGDNPNAMVAFRIMNTAMFMQLHHSIKVRSERVFIPSKNSEEYYRTIPLDKDYKWRSFQLAFILLNIDAFIKPGRGDHTVEDVFGTGWPERNEIADLVWFPTGGGKTEAYLGIIAFVIANRRFTRGEKGLGTTVLMRYTLRLLTLQQFQRASLLIFALDTIRKEGFHIPNGYSLGKKRITIGLFVGSGSLPNNWKDLSEEIEKIKNKLNNNEKVITKLPYTTCPWCGEELFSDRTLKNIHPNPVAKPEGKYGIKDIFKITCNNKGCTFHSRFPNEKDSLPVRLFDEDIYKDPPTLLFGTVDKFASLANKVSTNSGKINEDSRRLLGKGYKLDVLPPELIIQDELHLLLGPLGSAVGLFEKAIDKLCTYEEDNQLIKPKIITSTATTRNTDKQIFALFNRRSEIFPKQGINCDDSFFAYYERNPDNSFIANRKYMGLLPVGKTQVWLQLRIASLALVHRVKYLFDKGYTSIDVLDLSKEDNNEIISVMDYYHTVLAYYNSLKEVGKTESQLNHYLPDDIKLVGQNVLPWTFLNLLIKGKDDINYSELTGRLSGEEVKTNLSSIETKWNIWDRTEGRIRSVKELKAPPEFIISTNMISVGIDVSRFNTMIINSMPRNIAEYIQASSRVARDKEGVVFTVHHPFRTRDISHFQKFKEFHEKFYSYVEPISVTPFASKALERYFAMYMSVIIRHNSELELMNNDSASSINKEKESIIRLSIINDIKEVYKNAEALNKYLTNRNDGIRTSVEGIISKEEFDDVIENLESLFKIWFKRLEATEPSPELFYRKREGNHVLENRSLFIMNTKDSSDHWKVGYSLREIAPSTVIKTVQQ